MRKHRLPALAAASACLALAALASPAFAQSDADRATARSLGGDGQQALDSKDYKTAEDRFRRAESLVHAPTLMLGLARALAGQRKYVEAQETYNRIIREGLPPTASDTFKRALADAKKEVEGVSPKIGGATITVHDAGGAEVLSVKVLLDGSQVNTASLGVRRSIDPGSHVLQVSADGYKGAELHFDVPEGGSVDEPVTLDAVLNARTPEPPPGPPAAPSGSEPSGASSPSPGRGGARAALPWVAFGVGGTGLIIGAVAGFVAMGKHSDLAVHCPVGCPANQQDNVDSYHTVATLSTAGFIVGGAGIVAGVVLLVTQPNRETASAHVPQAGLHVVPRIGLGSIGATVEF
ncbi:MAG: hypothetical protein M3O46_17910 [Myxococcota bacterium]|nr:hypothetical protein [Myxococcota bacterium]